MKKNGQLKCICVVLALLFPVMAHAAVNTATSQFWKNLQAGKAQKIFVIGSSLCEYDWAKNWVASLGDTLNKLFPGLGSSVEHCAQSSFSTFLVEEQPAILAAKPNAIIYEVGEWDHESSKGCPLQSCAIANWKAAVAWTHKNLPGCDILFWTPWPVWGLPSSPESGRLTYQNAARQVASDSSLYLVDTYWKLDSIFQADPSPSCANTGGASCPLYSQYLYDGWHPSVMCGKTVIIPEILKQLKGSAVSSTHPLRMKEDACTIISSTHHAVDVSVYGNRTYQIECVKPDGRIIAKQMIQGPATIRLSNSLISSGMAVILIRIGKDIILKKQMPVIQ